MGDSRPLDIAKLEETLRGLEVGTTQEKPVKGKLQALHSVITSLRQYADLGAFQLTHSDSVSQYLTTVFHSLPSQLLSLLPSATEKQQIIGLQLYTQLFQLTHTLSQPPTSLLHSLLSTWQNSHSLFEAGKKAVLTQYQDLAFDLIITLKGKIEETEYEPDLFFLLRNWPIAEQIQPQSLIEALPKGKKRARVNRVDNFDPLLEGCKKEVDEDSFEYRYGEELGKTWAAVIAKELPKNVVVDILGDMEHTLTKVSNPLIFSDFLLVTLTQALFSGADRTLTILSLPGLLQLITRHGLECKQFYPRLYALFRKEIATGHCPRDQLRLLLERALGSPLLPASLPASFIKVICT